MKSVLIIGAGIIGMCTAHYAAQRGFEVTVVDREREDHFGCSYGNAGMIVPSHFIPLAAPGAVALGLRWMFNPESPFWIKPRLDSDLLSWAIKFWKASTPEHLQRAAPLLRDLHLASRECFEHLAEGGEFGLLKEGLLMLCKTHHALEEEARTAEKARALGIPAEVLDARAAAALEPGVRMDIAGAVYFPKDCHLTPHRLMSHLKKLAQHAGVRFVYEAEAREIRAKGRQVSSVITTRGVFQAHEYVVCGGSWSPILAKTLGLKLPMQAGKGYSLTLENPPDLPRICAILTEARVAVTPMGQALRIGGTMELAGLSEEINPVRVRGIIKAVPQYYPEFHVEHFDRVQPWRGLRPCSPDGLPYLGRTRRYQNLTVATGHAMMGLSLGPISGKLVAELLAGERPSIDLQLLDPDRYA